MIYDGATRVELRDLNSSIILDWLAATIGPGGESWDMLYDPRTNDFIFFFVRPEDATMFSLRWVG